MSISSPTNSHIARPFARVTWSVSDGEDDRAGYFSNQLEASSRPGTPVRRKERRASRIAVHSSGQGWVGSPSFSPRGVKPVAYNPTLFCLERQCRGHVFWILAPADPIKESAFFHGQKLPSIAFTPRSANVFPPSTR